MGILRGEGEKGIFSPDPMDADLSIDIKGWLVPGHHC